MNLSKIIQGTKESQEEFFNRSYWICDWDKSKVFVFPSQKERNNPVFKPTKISIWKN